LAGWVGLWGRTERKVTLRTLCGVGWFSSVGVSGYVRSFVGFGGVAEGSEPAGVGS
jgi:hypothetical protein